MSLFLNKIIIFLWLYLHFFYNYVQNSYAKYFIKCTLIFNENKIYNCYFCIVNFLYFSQINYSLLFS
jgi:hypothetical protein